jgi:transposase
LNHTASKRFWQCFEALPPEVQALARRNYVRLRADPSHPSLQFKSVGNGRFHSVRVGLYYRALGVSVADGVHWFWIGTHADYDKLVG